MKLTFHLMWCKRGGNPFKSFNQKSAAALLADYVERIDASFAPCRADGHYAAAKNPAGSRKIILCDKNPPSIMLTSDQLASRVGNFQNAGVKELLVIIGGADGLSAADIDALSPDLRWSFGPLTLPHELASVVAAEQIYRAYCILGRLPYHRGHD